MEYKSSHRKCSLDVEDNLLGNLLSLITDLTVIPNQ